VVEGFNRVFGVQHFTWKCFWRSCAASTSAVFLMTFIWMMLRPEEALAFNRGDAKSSIIMAVLGYLVYGMLVNWIPDYVSYVKTRRILEAMSNSNRFRRLFLLAVVDKAVSLSVFFAANSALKVIVGPPTRPPYKIPFSHLFVTAITLHATRPHSASLGVSLYAALFVSAWAWLYAILPRQRVSWSVCSPG